LLRLAVRVGADLRREGFEARTVTVKLRDHRFRTRSAQRSLALPITSDRAVFRVARLLLRRLRRAQAAPVRLLGIGLSHFEGRDAEATQLGLFDAPPSGPQPGGAEAPVVEDARDRALTAALDRIRSRFGAGAIVPAELLDRRRDPGPRVEEDPI
jgi:DNA polymerase-4